MVQSRDLPTDSSGRMKGYMAVIKELSDENELAHDLSLSSQNIRDQGARTD